MYGHTREILGANQAHCLLDLLGGPLYLHLTNTLTTTNCVPLMTKNNEGGGKVGNKLGTCKPVRVALVNCRT